MKKKNALKTYMMIKIYPKPKKQLKYPQIYKMTKIP